jgi:hypothetical protein
MFEIGNRVELTENQYANFDVKLLAKKGERGTVMSNEGRGNLKVKFDNRQLCTFVDKGKLRKI